MSDPKIKVKQRHRDAARKWSKRIAREQGSMWAPTEAAEAAYALGLAQGEQTERAVIATDLLQEAYRMFPTNNHMKLVIKGLADRYRSGAHTGEADAD